MLYRTSVVTALLLFLALVGPVSAQLEVPSVFSDHCVLQREMPVPVWGRAAAGAKVVVAFSDQVVTTIADATGAWRIDLTPLEAESSPQTLTITAAEERLEFSDVLVGEVWVCGGQSNMEWPVRSSLDSAAEILAGDTPRIREIAPAHRLSLEPVFSSGATWRVSSLRTVGDFTAIGTFFARQLEEELDVPVGLLSINWGGTRAEPWTDRASLAKHTMFEERVAEFEKRIVAYGMRDHATIEATLARKIVEYEEQMVGWWEKKLVDDPGESGGWTKPGFDDSGWTRMPVPGVWSDHSERLGKFDGIVWYRKEVLFPLEWAGKDLDLSLGAIDDADRTWFDGTLVGQTTNSWNTPRAYTIPGSVVTPGHHTVTIAVLDTGGAGGMTGEASLFRIDPVGSARTKKSGVPLWGTWQVERGSSFDGDRGRTRPTAPPAPAADSSGPGLMFDGMLRPFIPFAIRGAIWYQGESNAGQPEEYRALLPTTINSWRRAWKQGNFPFGIVQLAAFREPSDDPDQGGWALLRDAQRHTHRTMVETGLIVTTDVGDAKDIHPRNKQEVGRRLAQWALVTVHKKWAESTGPVFSEMVKPDDEEGSMRVFFHHARDLKTRDPRPPGGFGVAGEDGKYHWVEAKIERQTVVLKHPLGKEIVHIRYAWSDNPDRANLINGDGLPMEPFRWDKPKK